MGKKNRELLLRKFEVVGITFSATRKAHGITASVPAFMSTKSNEISYVSNLPMKSENASILCYLSSTFFFRYVVF